VQAVSRRSDPDDRARLALALISISPEYAVAK